MILRILGHFSTKRKGGDCYGNTLPEALNSFILYAKVCNIHNEIFKSIKHFFFSPQNREDLEHLTQQRKSISEQSDQKILPYITFVGNLEDDGEIDISTLPTVHVTDEFDFTEPAEEDFGASGEIAIIAEDTEVPGAPSETAQQLSRQVPEIHVVLEEKSYPIRTNKLLDAVDTCYKVIRLNNLGFPPECKHLWSMIGKVIYKSDELFNYSKVSTLITALEKITIEPAELPNLPAS